MNPPDQAASKSRTYVHQNKLGPFASTLLDSSLFVLSVFLPLSVCFEEADFLFGRVY